MNEISSPPTSSEIELCQSSSGYTITWPTKKRFIISKLRRPAPHRLIIYSTTFFYYHGEELGENTSWDMLEVNGNNEYLESIRLNEVDQDLKIEFDFYGRPVEIGNHLRRSEKEWLFETIKTILRSYRQRKQRLINSQLKGIIKRVFVDEDWCLDHFVCEMIAPNYFFEDPNKNGAQTKELSREEFEKELYAIIEAAQNCPVEAIKVELNNGTILDGYSKELKQLIKLASQETEVQSDNSSDSP